MNNGNSWIDLPIIQAIEYFQSIMNWFIVFARNFGGIIGAIGLAWTGFRLVNARIGVREMLWDTIYKWMVYILLLNCYPVLTYGVQKVANDVGLVAGDSKEVLKSNFVALQKKIKTDVQAYEQWSMDFESDISDIVGIPLELEPLTKGSNAIDWFVDNEKIINNALKNFYDSKKDRKAIQNQIADYIENMTGPSEQTIYSERTLETLNAILIRKGPNGKPTADLTNSYIDLDLWLKDKNGEETNTFSCASLFRIGLLCGQIMWEQSQQNLVAYKELVASGMIKNDDGTKMTKWDKFQEKNAASISTMVMAGFGFVIILFSIAFAIIQYAMCAIEFAIIQGIGAFFIPFYLFDATKDIPKKLVPVFIGLFIKIIVMVICLMFIVRLWLDFAVEQINPANGGVSWATLGTVIFTGLLSFILTSNAPKIAMTILTGQPQMSMGEFMAAVGTMVGGAAAVRNAGEFAASPVTNAAKVQMGEAHQRHQASSAAKQKAMGNFKSGEYINSWKSAHGVTGKMTRDQKAAMKKDLNHAKKASADSAGQAASDAVYEKQRANYMNNGGAWGTAKRMIAHYTGGVTNPVQTLKSGRNYQSPNGIMHDFMDIAGIADEKGKNPPQITPDDEQNQTTNVKNKKQPLPDSFGFDPRAT